MKIVIANLSLVLLASSASAHDFWLQPNMFRADVGDAVPLVIQVGHGDDRDRWTIDPQRVVLMKLVGPSGETDLRPTIGQGGVAADVKPTFSQSGLHVVAMETNYAVSELPADKFTDYAKSEGLTPALNHRIQTGTTASNGREIYSRRAKTFIRVGKGKGADPRAMRPIGLTLEIVPERDPNALGKNRDLPVRVIYEGGSLAGATVKLSNLEADKKPIETKKTDKMGRATFRIPERGTWLLNVVWTKPISGRPDADFDTIFSSLTFG